jgi:anti-sigma B factor antagonist
MSIPNPPNVLSLEGPLDFHTSERVRSSLRTIIDQKPKRVVVDLSRVPYIDSSGLAVLVGAMQATERDGGLLMLAGAQKAVLTIMESARLDRYFLLFPHVDAALAAP